MKHTKTKLLLTLITLSGQVCIAGSPSIAEFQTLAAQSCVPLSSSPIKPSLSAQWQPYLSATRVCPLAQGSGIKASIILVSVFHKDYYRNKPADAAWENFPKPLFFDTQGRCVAGLPELYPDEPPREMVLSYGHWQGTIPGMIRVHVVDPAVGGDYDLPTFIWDTKLQRYSPNLNSTETDKGNMVCPPP